MTLLHSGEIYASGGRSLSPEGRNDEGETNGYGRLNGLRATQLVVDLDQLFDRRRRARLNRPRRFKHGSGAAWNPTLRTEVALRAASDTPPSREWPPFLLREIARGSV